MYPVLNNRPVWIEVNTQQLQENLNYVKMRAKEQVIWAVVKSDAYNHGIDGLLAHFIAADISHFCVGNFDEAQQLQNLADAINKDIKILIFGVIPGDKLMSVPDNWSITMSSRHFADQYTSILQQNPHKKINVQIKIDSGMNRRGFKDKQAFVKVWDMLQKNPQYEVVGLYTHFSTADTDVAFMQKQVQQFREICGNMLDDVQYVHAQNSYGLLNLGAEASMFNALRVGGICYGLSGQRHDKLSPIFSLYGEIIETKYVTEGETISYGNTHTFERAGWIGVVPIGYADGWRRKNTNLTVYVKGRPVQIVGTICMEQLMIFAEENFFAVGDTVEFIGQHSDLFEVATHDEITDYELICSFLGRIPRKYISERKGAI